MANNDGAPETFHEVPASKYYYLGDSIGAVPKWLFKFWTPFIFFLGVSMAAIGLLTNWYSLAATGAWNFFIIQNLAVTAPVLIFAGLTGYVYLHYKRKQKAKARREAEHQRAYQNAVIQQGSKQR